jgi:catechol 2,3-dioxygenase-like lactoylglutathione lyase family enzyme
MRPLAIRYVRDMEASQRFYTALGLRVDFAGRAPRRGGSRWVELVGGQGGLLALHQTDLATDPAAVDPAAADPAADPEFELAFEAEEPLEDVVARLRLAGYEPATAIVDESYGRSFTVHDPEGLKLQINEHDRALHG